ncbi:MAG: 50S ribosomal protein L39e [Candidatus Nanoarchaeia archaeon]
MVKVQSSGKKKRLGRAARQTKWAPIWVVPKALGKGKKVHPARLTFIKRNWRKTKLKA